MRPPHDTGGHDASESFHCRILVAFSWLELMYVALLPTIRLFGFAFEASMRLDGATPRHHEPSVNHARPYRAVQPNGPRHVLHMKFSRTATLGRLSGRISGSLAVSFAISLAMGA